MPNRVESSTLPGSRHLRPLAMMPILRWALLGSLFVLVLVGLELNRTGNTVLNLIQPGATGPSHQVFEQDFPGAALPDGIGHDGQQYYAIARSPLHPIDVAPQLGGNPRYRLQRILFPTLAWMLHPSGGGFGLVYALIALSAIGVIAGGIATGALSMTLGGPAWGALAFAALPGTYFAARITVADNLALAFLLGAITLSLRRHWGWAIVLAVAAGMTREVTLVPLIGFVLWRRDREGVALAAVPLAVAMAWFLVLRSMFEGYGYNPDRLAPFAGVIDSLPYWASDEGRLSAEIAVATVVVLVALVARRRRSPLFWPAILSFVSTTFYAAEALNLATNLARNVAPTMVLAALALLGKDGYAPDPRPPLLEQLRSWRTPTGAPTAAASRP